MTRGQHKVHLYWVVTSVAVIDFLPMNDCFFFEERKSFKSRIQCQTYAVQENADLSPGVDCRLLATELAHFA